MDNTPVLSGLSVGSAGVTVGLTFFSWSNMGLIISAASCIILTILASISYLKKIRNLNVDHAVAIAEEKRKSELASDRHQIECAKLQLINEQIKNEQNKEYSNARVHVLRRSDSCDSDESFDRKWDKNEQARS